MKRHLKLQTANLSESDVDQIVAENEELYHSQIAELEREYGGKLVKDKVLHQLLTMQAIRHKTKTGEYPDTIRPPEFPAEEFIPIQVTFTVAFLGLDLPRWYFIRRAKIFSVR